MSENIQPTREQRKARDLIEVFEKSCGPHLGVIAAEICVKEILSFVVEIEADEIYWQKVLDEIQTF